MSTKIKKVTIAGSGVLGYQIALNTLFNGFDVTVYDISDEFLEKAKNKFDEVAEHFNKEGNVSLETIASSKANLHYSSDLSTAVKDADLVIEAIPENPDIKKDFYNKLAPLAPEQCIFATNTSTLLPSEFSSETGRPNKFLAMHFANELWIHKIIEIMGTKDTSEEVFDEAIEFAKATQMVPIPLHKEQPGYILNSLLLPFHIAALKLWINGIAEPEMIDKTWMLSTRMPIGSFGIIDVSGMNTIINTAKLQAKQHPDDPFFPKLIDRLQTEFVDKGKLGTSSGEGFYSYPNPKYKNPEFLKS